MAELDRVTEQILDQISGEFKQEGAYNLRQNGVSICHGDSEHVKIKRKEDRQGIDIYIDGETKGETVSIPVVVNASGMDDQVYNDFYIADGADVVIIAGCGIHNSGCNDSRHNGIHSFHVGKNANVRYEEKHYGEGEGTGARILDPVTKIYIGEDSVFTLDTAQIKGVDSTKRETEVELDAGAKLYVIEKLMTHGSQFAESNMEVRLNGEGSSAQIISRSVAKGTSRQVFHPKAVGNAKCQAHVQCDSIIMDHAEVASIPEINARHFLTLIQNIHQCKADRRHQKSVDRMKCSIPRRDFNIIRLNLSQNFCRKYKDQNRNFQCCRKLDLQIDLYKAWNNQQQQGENTQENIFIILIKKLQNHHQNDQNSECHIHDKRAFMLS